MVVDKVTPARAVDNYKDLVKHSPKEGERNPSGQEPPEDEEENFGPAAELILSSKPGEIQSADNEGKITIKPRSGESE